MPDPTEFVITAAFSTAFGIFALTATARMLIGKTAGSLPEPAPAPEDEGSPYLPPLAPALPPPLPVGRVRVGFYRPLDLLGIGFIFVLFFGLVVGSVRSSGKAEPVLDPVGKIPEFKYCAVKVTPGGQVGAHSSFGGGQLLAPAEA